MIYNLHFVGTFLNPLSAAYRRARKLCGHGMKSLAQKLLMQLKNT